jgi:hypothetical protein
VFEPAKAFYPTTNFGCWRDASSVNAVPACRSPNPLTSHSTNPPKVVQNTVLLRVFGVCCCFFCRSLLAKNPTGDAFQKFDEDGSDSIDMGALQNVIKTSLADSEVVVGC